MVKVKVSFIKVHVTNRANIASKYNKAKFGTIPEIFADIGWWKSNPSDALPLSFNFLAYSNHTWFMISRGILLIYVIVGTKYNKSLWHWQRKYKQLPWNIFIVLMMSDKYDINLMISNCGLKNIMKNLTY